MRKRKEVSGKRIVSVRHRGHPCGGTVPRAQGERRRQSIGDDSGRRGRLPMGTLRSGWPKPSTAADESYL